MLDYWAKVHSFFDLMDIQDLHSSPPLSSTSSISSSSTCNSHPLSIGAERWQVVEKTTQQILCVIQPTADSEKRRKDIIEYIQTLIEDSFGIKVFPFGSVPLKTYLPHGDVDLTAVSLYDSNQDLAADICTLLQDEEKNNTRIQVRDVLYVPAQVRVVKCMVGNIAVDISFNQTAGLFALFFLEQVDQFIGKDHLFKRSVILIKAWCFYESRTLGGFHGLISTYALETLILHVINHFHSTLHCPLAVLFKFLKYYSTFDWGKSCIGISGLVLLSSLPEIEVRVPQDSDEVLLTDDFLRHSREAFSSYAGVDGTERPAFAVKFLNIMDPLRDDNNLGRSVSKGNFYRIRNALSYGSKKLSEYLTLPPEKISEGLEKFFVTTLELNRRGRRADVLVSVPQYGTEISSANRDSDILLGHIQYGVWFHNYRMMHPLQPNRSETQFCNNGWLDMGKNLRYDQNSQYDQNMYYNIDETQPSIDSPRNFYLANGAFVDEKRKSRGTGLYIPHIEPYLTRDTGYLENGYEEENAKGVERMTNQACILSETSYSDEGGDKEATYRDLNGSGSAFNFCVEEFPVLPGTKPIPINFCQSGASKYEQVNDTSVSNDSVENGSLKYSSPRSMPFSEPGKPSDSEVSVILDLSNKQTVALEEDQESSKSEGKTVVQVQPLELADEKEFPPLGRPAKPEIRLSKKEFPTLRASMKLEKRSKWRKNIKETPKDE